MDEFGLPETLVPDTGGAQDPSVIPTDLAQRNSDILRQRVARSLAGKGGIRSFRDASTARASTNLMADFPEETKAAAREALRITAITAADETPDAAAARANLSAKVGAPAEALRDPELRKLYEDMAKWTGIKANELAGTPLGEWMSTDPMNMTLVHDDKSLTDMQLALKELPAKLDTEGKRRAWLEQRVQRMQSERTTNEFWNFVAQNSKPVFGTLGKYVDKLENIVTWGDESLKLGFGEWLMKEAGKGAIEGPQQFLRDKETGKFFRNPETEGFLAENFNRSAYNHLSSVPGELLKFVVLGRLLGAAGVAEPAIPAATGLLMGAESGSEAIHNAQIRRQQMGLPENPLADLTEGSIHAATTYLLMGGRVGGFGIPHAVRTDTLLGELAQKTGRAFTLGPTSAVASNLAARLHGDTPDVWDGALQGAMSFLPWEHMSTFQRMRTEAKDSLLLKRSEVKYKEAVREVVKGTDFERAAINANELQRFLQENTSDSIEKFTQPLGVSRDQLRVALATNGNIEIPMESYLAHIAPSEHAEGLSDLVRLSTDLSVRMADVKTRMFQIIDNARMQRDMEALPSLDPVRDRIRDSVANDLAQSTKALTPRQAAEAGDYYARMIMVLAKRAEKTPDQILDTYRLKIVGSFAKAIEGGPNESGADALGRSTTGLPASPAGRADAGLPAPARGVQGEGGQGAEGRVGEGQRPPARTWHGTAGTGFGHLKAEGINAPSAAGMGPGLHVSAGPEVANAYAEGNPEGLWRVGVRSNYTPFDASTESTYSPEAAKSLGIEIAQQLSGADLWAHLTAEVGTEKAVELLSGKGFHGLYYNHGGEDAWSVWKDEHIIGSVPTDLPTALEDYQLQGSRRDATTGMLKAAQAAKMFQPVTARIITAKGAPTQDPTVLLHTNLNAMLEHPKMLTKTLDKLETFPGIRASKGTPEQRANQFIDHVASNLLFLFDKMPDDVRNRAKLWYDGAQVMARQFADEHGKTLSQMSAVIATLSPQMDWFQNVELARQLITIMRDQQNTVWDAAMTKRVADMPAFKKKLVDQVKGKTLGELTDDKLKGVWVRAYAETYGSKLIPLLNPEGTVGGVVNTKKGVPQNLAWSQGFDTFAKAIRVYNDASPEQISAALGTANKVRNFYNNIFDPSSPDFTTIDTHAAAAGYLLPLAAKSDEANMNFGGGNAKTGVVGAYGLLQEAYVRAANERGVLPREMQSITWEAVRGLFGVESKMAGIEDRGDFRESKLYWDAANVWNEFDEGKITRPQAQERILKLAGGITAPSWTGAPVGTRYYQPVGDVATAQHFGLMSLESMPGGNVRSGIFPNIDNATHEQLKSYHTEKIGIVLNTLREAGVPVADTSTGHGYWDGESNPVTAFKVELSDNDPEALLRAARITASVVNDQDAIGWNAKPDPEAPADQHNAAQLSLARDLTKAETISLGRALDASGLPVFLDASDPASPRVVSYAETAPGETTVELQTKLQGVLAKALPADINWTAETYKASSGLVERSADGDAEVGTGQAGEQGAEAGAVARGRAAVESLNQRYRTEFGWGQPDAGGGRRDGSLPVFVGRLAPEDSVDLHGVHYSGAEQLTELRGDRFGTGSAGREQRRLAGVEQSSDPTLQLLAKRTYFYISEDGDLPAKERVVTGTNPFEVQLTGILDTDASAEKTAELLTRSRAWADEQTGAGADYNNAFEREVVQAGYNGYTRDVPGGGRMVVVLGHDTVPVRHYDPRTDLEGPTAGVTRLEQPAYHGSPYKFDKFTTDHMGAGEGEQAFGWGLYFAGDRAVAEYYRQSVRGRFTYDGKEVRGDVMQEAADLLWHAQGDKAAAVSDLQYFAGYNRAHVAAVRAAVLRMDFEKLVENKGQLYKVDIPDSSTMLLWDKPISEQPEAVKKALETFAGELWRPGLKNPAIGGDFYRELKNSLLGDNPTNQQASKAASLALQKAGISGIKYLDGNSREATDGSYNFVVFDENAINVLETYYQPEGEGKARGYIEFGRKVDGEPRTFDLALLKDANKSTFFHEIGHFYLEVVADLAQSTDASDSIKAQWAAIQKQFGITSYNELTTEMHEKFADGLLLHLKEGRAITEDMRQPMREFSAWMTKLGRKLISAKVDMNDELRGIFDRLIATDDEIALAEKDLPNRVFSTAEQAGMSDREFKVYTEAAQESIARGREKMIAKLMREMERTQNTAYKNELAGVREEVTKEVEARPEYVALKALAAGTLADGETPVKLSREQLVERYGKDILKQLGKDGSRVVYSDDPTALSADDAAVRLNLFDGDGNRLVEALKDLQPRRQVVADISKQLMEERHPGLLQDKEALRAEAIRQIGESGRDQLLATELAALRRKASAARAAVGAALGDASDEAKAAARDRAALHGEQQRISADNARQDRAAQNEALAMPDLANIRMAASAFIANQPIFELRPDRLLQAQRQSSAEAYRLSLRNDYEGAARAKEQELFGHYLYLEAARAKAEAEAFRGWVKKNDSSTVRGKIGQAGAGYLAQFDAIRDMLGIERLPNKQLDTRERLSDWIRGQQDEAKDPIIADWLANLREPINYRQLSTAQLRDVAAALKNIKHLAYLELGTMIEGRRVEYKAMIDELSDAMANNSTRFVPLRETTATSRQEAGDKIGAKLQGLDSTLVKLELVMNWIDGNDVNGPAHRYIWDRLVKAQDELDRLTEEIHAPIIKAMEDIPKELRNKLRTETIDIGMTDKYGNPAPKTRGEILTMLLYSGQDVRRMKLLEGYASRGLTEEKLNAALAQLTPEEVQFAETIWSQFDALRPKILDLEERLTGVRPQWDEGREIKVGGRTLKGGYFPLEADPALVGELGKKNEGGTVQQILSGNGYSRAATSTSHTKELTGATYPLLLDYQSILTSSLRNQIKDLTHREAVLSINRILRNDKFAETMKERIGEAYESQLMPWLANVASDGNMGYAQGLGPVTRLIEASRANTTAAVLAFKYSSVIVQLADLTRVIAPGDYRVSVGNLSKAFARLAPLSPERGETIEMIKQLSPEMRHRAENLDRDMRSRLNELRGDDGMLASWNKAGFAGLGMMDSLVSWPTWLGAYEQNMAKHGDQGRAAKEADRTVRTLLMTGAPKDLIPMQANKNPAFKLLTMFMGDASSNYNSLRNAGHNINGLKGIPTFTGLLAFVMLNAVLGDWLKGQGPDKGESGAAWIARKALLAPLGTAPIVRDFGQALDNVIAGKPGDYRFTNGLQPVQKLLDVIKHGKKLSDGSEDMLDFAIRVGEAGGYTAGIGGTAQAAASARYFKRYMEGTENPDNPIQFTYDLVRGKSKEPNR